VEEQARGGGKKPRSSSECSGATGGGETKEILHKGLSITGGKRFEDSASKQKGVH